MRLACFLVCAIVWSAPAEAQLSKVETADVRIVYVEGSESYLVPHATRAFLNALDFARRQFKFEPFDPISVLLVDFSDSGNAAAGVVPRNVMSLQIAPLNFAFETMAANERMTTLMLSTAPETARMMMAMWKSMLSPNAIIVRPKAATATSKTLPACARMGINISNRPMSAAPVAGAARR